LIRNDVLEVVSSHHTSPVPGDLQKWRRNEREKEAQEPHAPATAQPGAEPGRSSSPDISLMLPSTQLTRIKKKIKNECFPD